MKIIADTNVYLAVALDEPEKSEIINLTTGHELIAPIILPFEIGNALSAMFKRKRLNHNEVLTIWDIIQTIPIELRDINIKKAVDLASQFNIYAYDAYFLECAIELQLPLLTLDSTMHRLAQTLNIQTLEVNK